jgi:hypothetical protein
MIYLEIYFDGALPQDFFLDGYLQFIFLSRHTLRRSSILREIVAFLRADWVLFDQKKHTLVPILKARDYEFSVLFIITTK